MGGVLIPRGTNVAADAKHASDRLPRVAAGLFDRLREELGFDTVRLLVFWDALEPAPGRWSASYLTALRRLVDDAGRAGLSVVIDMHQDVFGEGFGHAGVPEHAAPGVLYDAFRPPRRWALSYLELPVMRAFDGLWRDPSGLADAWARIAAALRGSEALLAADLLNEPHWGTDAPASFERSTLPEVQAALADAVRGALPDLAVALEPAPTASLGLGTALRSKVAPPAIYAPHFYPAALELGLGYDGDRAALAQILETMCADAERMGLPLLIGEVGARSDVPGSAAYLRDVYDLFDGAMVGALQWDLSAATPYALLRPDGRPTRLARAIVRPHPSRIAGVPLGFRWEPAHARFRVSWEESGRVQGETVLSAPRLAFPGGIIVEVEGGGPYRVERGRVRLPQVGGRRDVVLRDVG